MDTQEFMDRIMGSKIDISLRHKEASEKAVLLRVEKMPIVETLSRIGNEIEPNEGEYPCYLQVSGEDAIDIGYINLTLETLTTCLTVLRHVAPKAYWVHEGVIGEEITTDELIGTIKFKKGGTIHEYI